MIAPIRPAIVTKQRLGIAVRDRHPQEEIDALRREMNAAVLIREFGARAERGGISAEHLPELIAALTKAVVR